MSAIIFIIMILALSGVEIGRLEQVDQAWLITLAIISGLGMFQNEKD